MANDVEIIITADDRSGPAFAKAKARAKKFQKDMQDTADGAAKDFGAAGDQIEKDLGESFDKVAKDADKSFDEIGVSIRKKIDAAFAEVQKTVNERMKSVESDAEDHGHGVGDGLVKGITRSLSSGLGKIRSQFSSIFRGSSSEGAGRGIAAELIADLRSGLSEGAKTLKGSFDGVAKGLGESAGPVLITALIGAIMAALPAAGTLMGGVLLGAIGTSLVGLGAFIASKLNVDGIKDKFKALGKDLKPVLEDAVRPLVPAMESVIGVAKDVAGELGPAFKVGFQIVQDDLARFVSDFGAAFKELEPAIKPGAEAFAEILREIGPALPGIFENISDAVVNLSREISENKDLFRVLFEGALNLIPLVINLFAGLTHILGSSVNAFSGFMSAFAGFQVAVMGSAERLLGAFRAIGEAFMKIPGMENIGRGMVIGIDKAIAKIQEWKREAEGMQKTIEIRAEIRDLEAKLSLARAQLSDPNLTKERRAEINANIDRLNAKLAEALVKLGDPNLIRERKAFLTADIERLKSRIADAKKELDSPNISRERKARLNADIAALQAKLRTAQNAINALKGKSVSINITTYYNTVRKTEKARASAHGGILGSSIPGYASGGLSGVGAGVFALVGEQGPELVSLPYGSTVVPTGQTDRILDDEGLDYDDVEGFAKGGKTGAKKKPKPKAKKAKTRKPAKKSVHQLTPPKKKAKPKVTYGVDSEGNTVELWDIPEPEPKKQALKANDRKPKAQARKANDRKPAGAQARKANTRKPAKKSIHQLTPSDVPRKKSIHQLTPSDVHGRSGGSDGVYVDGSQGGGYVDTYDGAYSDAGEVSVSNLEGGMSGPSWSGMSGGGGVTQPVVNVYVQGSIRSDRDIVALIRDAFLNGGFRGVLPT